MQPGPAAEGEAATARVPHPQEEVGGRGHPSPGYQRQVQRKHGAWAKKLSVQQTTTSCVCMQVSVDDDFFMLCYKDSPCKCVSCPPQTSPSAPAGDSTGMECHTAQVHPSSPAAGISTASSFHCLLRQDQQVLGPALQSGYGPGRWGMWWALWVGCMKRLVVGMVGELCKGIDGWSMFVMITTLPPSSLPSPSLLPLFLHPPSLSPPSLLSSSTLSSSLSPSA